MLWETYITVVNFFEESSTNLLESMSILSESKEDIVSSISIVSQSFTNTNDKPSLAFIPVDALLYDPSRLPSKKSVTLKICSFEGTMPNVSHRISRFSLIVKGWMPMGSTFKYKVD